MKLNETISILLETEDVKNNIEIWETVEKQQGLPLKTEDFNNI